MLHLLPIRWILQATVIIVGLMVLSAVYLGWIGRADSLRDAALLIRWSSLLAVGVIVFCFAGWRWVPAVQGFIFPYLGGWWSGSIRFEDESGAHRRDVTLEIKHTLFGLRLLLDSRESMSRTLVVHAERDQDFERFRLYYVYLNERKEGFAGARERYRGLAIIRVERGNPIKLLGDYFTETHRYGTLHLSLDTPHPWWKIWR